MRCASTSSPPTSCMRMIRRFRCSRPDAERRRPVDCGRTCATSGRPAVRWRRRSGSPIRPIAEANIRSAISKPSPASWKPTAMRPFFKLYGARQERSRPLLDSMKAWLQETLAALSQKSATARAIRYALSRWEALGRFATTVASRWTTTRQNERCGALHLGARIFFRGQ